MGKSPFQISIVFFPMGEGFKLRASFAGLPLSSACLAYISFVLFSVRVCMCMPACMHA